MEEPSDGLHEKQKHGRRCCRKQTYLAFGSGWTALGCIDNNNNSNNNNSNNNNYYYYYYYYRQRCVLFYKKYFEF